MERSATRLAVYTRWWGEERQEEENICLVRDPPKPVALQNLGPRLTLTLIPVSHRSPR